MNLTQCVVTLLMILQYGNDVQAGDSGAAVYTQCTCGVDGIVATVYGNSSTSPGDVANVSLAAGGVGCLTLATFDGYLRIEITIPFNDCGTTSNELNDGTTEYSNQIIYGSEDLAVSCVCIPAVSVQCDSDEMVATINQSRYFTDDHGQPSDVQIEYTLNVNSCQETHNLTEDEVVIDIPLDSCGTTTSESGEQLVYTNILSAKVVSTSANNTSQDEDRAFTVTCRYNRSEVLSVALDPTVLNEEDVDNYGEFGFQMSLLDSSGLSLDTSSPVQVSLGDNLTVEVNVTQVSVLELVLFVKKCWATPTSYSNDAIYYTLIHEGCEVNVDYTCTDNQTTHQFTVDAFRFVQSSEVYIHCTVFVCSSSASSSACDCPVCDASRKRRSPENEADDSYDKGSHVYKVPSIGPIVKVGEDDGKQDYRDEEDRKTFPITVLIIGLVSGFVAIAVIVIVVILVMRSRRQRATLTVERNNEVSVKLYNQVPAAEQL